MWSVWFCIGLTGLLLEKNKEIGMKTEKKKVKEERKKSVGVY